MSDLRAKLVLELIDRITSPVRKLADNFTRASIKVMQAAEKMRAKVIKVGEAAQKVGEQLSTRISLPITLLGVASVKTAAKFESLLTSLATATGSQEKANEAFNMISKFAATTPFELEEILGAYIKLKNLGLDPTTASLTSFGNTASAMGKSLDQFVEAVADATTGEFERLKEFGIKARVEGKKVTFTFQGQSKTIRNTGDEIQKYLKEIGDVKFAGGMEKQSATFNGIMSNLADSVSATLAKIGNSVIVNLELKDFFKDLGAAIASVGEAFIALPAPVQKFIIITAVVLAVIGPAIIVVAQFAIGIASLIYTFTLLTPALIAAMAGLKSLSIALLTTPIGWVVLGITALATAAYLIYRHWDRVADFFKGVWNGITDAFTTGVDATLELLQPLLDAIRYVKGGIASVGNKLGFGPDSEASSSVVPATNSSSASPPSLLRQRVDTGGQLHIRIDSEGQAKVLNASPNDKSMDYAVDTGLMMGAY